MQETKFPFEILIHDDASTDNTKKIIHEYIERYPELIRVVFQKENQLSKAGLIAPRFLFPLAQGKYIALCEGDDYWKDKSKLQKQVDFLEKNPEYVITYTNCQPFDKTGMVDIDFGGATRDLSSDELKKCTPIYTMTVCFRNVIKEIPPELLVSKFGDLTTWSLLGAHGKGKFLGDIKPSAYRVHGGGIFSKVSKRKKYEMGLITYAAIYTYYHKLGEDNIALYFKLQILITVVKSAGYFRISKNMLVLLLNKIKFKVKKSVIRLIS